MKYPEAIQQFLKFYKDFSLEKEIFNHVYSEDIFFQDPFHKVKGREELYHYFQKMMEQVPKCHFEIFDVALTEKEKKAATVTWDMKFEHKRLNRGKPIVVNGVTHLRYDNQITFHRDYFDSSQLIYKNIPVIRSIIGLIEGGMA